MASHEDAAIGFSDRSAALVHSLDCYSHSTNECQGSRRHAVPCRASLFFNNRKIRRIAKLASQITIKRDHTMHNIV